jgi:uncharacterized protein (UPF0335 family)
MAEKLDRVGRNSYELSDKAKEVLKEMKILGIDKSKIVSLSLEYIELHKEDFINDFVTSKMLESLKKAGQT